MLVSLGLFLAVTSTTVVSVALPTIGRRLHAGATGLEWVVDAHAIVYASMLIPGGAFGDRLGPKQLFMLGAGIFAAGAFGCGLARSLAELESARMLQGAGAALLVPGSLAIIRATFEDECERAFAIGIWSTSSGVALAAGPPLGGALVDAFGWRGVVLALVPIALALLAASARHIPRLERVAPSAELTGSGRCWRPRGWPCSRSRRPRARATAGRPRRCSPPSPPARAR